MSSRKHEHPKGSSKCHKCGGVLTPTGPQTRRRSLDSSTCRNCENQSGKSPKPKATSSGSSTRTSKTTHQRESNSQGSLNESKNTCKKGCNDECDGYCDERKNEMLINPAFAHMCAQSVLSQMCTGIPHISGLSTSGKRSRAEANIGEEDARVKLDNKKIDSLRESLRVEDENRYSLKVELDALEAENTRLNNNLSKIKRLLEDC